MQSLPVGSYYQIIGYGAHFKLWNEEPMEYNQENLEETIDFIKSPKGDFGDGNNIFIPLNYIYSEEIYKKISLPKKIIILSESDTQSKTKLKI